MIQREGHRTNSFSPYPKVKPRNKEKNFYTLRHRRIRCPRHGRIRRSYLSKSARGGCVVSRLAKRPGSSLRKALRHNGFATANRHGEHCDDAASTCGAPREQRAAVSQGTASTSAQTVAWVCPTRHEPCRSKATPRAVQTGHHNVVSRANGTRTIIQ